MPKKDAWENPGYPKPGDLCERCHHEARDHATIAYGGCMVQSCECRGSAGKLATHNSGARTRVDKSVPDAR